MNPWRWQPTAPFQFPERKKQRGRRPSSGMDKQ